MRPNSRKVQFLGGSCFDFSQYDSQHRAVHRDRHGNEIVYEFEDLGSGRKRPARVVDTLGREVLLGWAASPNPFANPYGRLDSVTVKNHAGADLTHRFEYVQKWVEPTVWGYWSVHTP